MVSQSLYIMFSKNNFEYIFATAPDYYYYDYYYYYYYYYFDLCNLTILGEGYKL
jgi:hypothetical protein